MALSKKRSASSLVLNSDHHVPLNLNGKLFTTAASQKLKFLSLILKTSTGQIFKSFLLSNDILPIRFGSERLEVQQRRRLQTNLPLKVLQSDFNEHRFLLRVFERCRGGEWLCHIYRTFSVV